MDKPLGVSQLHHFICRMHLANEVRLFGLESPEQTSSARARQEGRERFEVDEDSAECRGRGGARIPSGEGSVCVVGGAIIKVIR
ncbi:hypothetical protein M404DRAFT_383630 [Pisolithus tinctorius Marx 270]|uniref:Uncharacterized protein n=1 Tax=Pisolithus tinctorius Marx 270 TaxID=870435 RepID=A0A0C3NF91_PISTI|nr:hypothetical protein M404DRAFT_383630 [Pisolithus tinctorius Marx 270]